MTVCINLVCGLCKKGYELFKITIEKYSYLQGKEICREEKIS